MNVKFSRRPVFLEDDFGIKTLMNVNISFNRHQHKPKMAKRNSTNNIRYEDNYITEKLLCFFYLRYIYRPNE